MSKITRLQTDFEKLIAGDKSIEVRAVLGRADGTVKSTTTAENVYVTLYNGNVIEIYNERVPRVPYRKIIIGYDARDPNLLQVLRFDDVYDTRPHPNLPNHKESHTWFGYDPIDVYAQQIMPLLPRSIGALVVRVYGGDYFCNGADHVMNTTDVDLAAEIPASGAEWVDVEIDDAGAISFKHGTVNKASRELLLPEDRPIRTVTKKLLFSAKMYVGLTEFIQTRTDSDIFDPRFTGFGEGGASVAIDWTDVENKPLVFPPDLTITDAYYPRKWYKSAAPTANDDYSAGYEKADIWIDQSNGNAWVCIENGETACLAGSAVWVMVGGGGSSGSLFQVEGRLAVIANAAQPILITKDTTISAVYVYLENPGTAGSTIIDIYQNNLCLTSIFTNICDNRPEILFSDPNGWVKVVPSVTDFVEGDILFLSIDQVATLAENMLVVLDVSSSGGGGAGLTITDGIITATNVGQITIEEGEVIDNGGGQVTLRSYLASLNYVMSRANTVYNLLTTGDGTVITELDIVFTPKKAGNIVILEWIVNGEMSHDAVFTVKRNGTLLANAVDGSNNRYSGTTPSPYDVDTASTPANIVVKIVDEDSLDVETTYSVAARMSYGVTGGLYLNRTVASAGADAYETSLSMGTATEIST